MGFGGVSALGEDFGFRGVCLEIRYTGNGIVGSNPTLSVPPLQSPTTIDVLPPSVPLG